MNVPPDVHDAIRSLAPGAGYFIGDVSDLSTLTWHDASSDLNEDGVYVGPADGVVIYTGPKPTVLEIEAELARMTAEWESSEYARQRALAYPAIGDQLDALFHAGVFPDDMAAQLQAVKDRYPKNG